MITVRDLENRLAVLSKHINMRLWIEHYSGQMNPYRIITDDNQIVFSGTRLELYIYITGALKGINSYKQAHNLR